MHRIVTFKIDEALLELLDEYARREGRSRSEVIREAIVRLLRSEGYDVEGARRRAWGRSEERGIVIEVSV